MARESDVESRIVEGFGPWRFAHEKMLAGFEYNEPGETKP
jgi:hypothetical protein